MNDQEFPSYVLGLDIGSNSIGWALLEAEPVGTTGRLSPKTIKKAGVRIFEDQVNQGFETGREEPPGVKRRQARGQRRQTARRAGRLKHIFTILQNAGLLPPGQGSSPEDRHHFFLELDQFLNELNSRETSSSGPTLHLLPYLLRAKALDEKLAPDELGRAFYHLAQRRGFKSNRRAGPKEEKPGEVRKGINQLRQEMDETGARTLGEYFAGLDPEQQRIRGRWTARPMYEDEFERIWTAQSRHYPEILTAELKQDLQEALFFQRPLKSQRHLVGKCELEPGRPRAPLAILAAQRFRLLQQVNHTEVITPLGEVRPFSAEERAGLIDHLEINGDLDFKKAKKLLGLSKDHVFNFEEGSETKFLGNRTAAKLVKVFGAERWTGFSPEEKSRVIEDVLTIENETALARRGREFWGLNEEKAAEFSRIELEKGYARLSRRALQKLLPLLEQGLPYMTARNQVYGEAAPPEPLEKLPPLSGTLPELRNPVVARALTELRKVVNAIIREYGKPALVRVELARDLKKSRKQRKEITLRNRSNEASRQKAAQQIIKDVKEIQQPSRADIEKYLLAEECNWVCPFTGKSMSMADLFGPEPQFDVEHIIPFSRCLDNSFFNKTLCWHEENRNIKHNRTPYEAYGSNPQKWAEIIERVGRFDKKSSREKLRRFRLESLDEIQDFVSRQLNDTRYASRLARKYLGLLYGAEANRRVQVGTGQVTAYLRGVWDLNRILGGGVKTRDDHRHHAIDALATGLTDPGTIQMLSRAASGARREGRRLFAQTDPPWDAFLEDTRRTIQNLTVSHRVSRRLRGPLHEETHYSPPKTDNEGRTVRHVRKPLKKLTSEEVKNIVDDVVRAKVEARLMEVGEKDPRKVFNNKDNLPFLETRTGRRIPIRKVRIKKVESTFSVGRGPRERHVVSKDNHHLEIVETKDAKCRPVWEGHLVSLFEAARRRRAGEPVIKRDHGPDKRFLFSLAVGEIIEMDGDNGGRALYRIRSVWTEEDRGRVAFVRIADARTIGEIKKSGQWFKPMISKLRERNCRKVTVGPLGEVRWAND